MAKNPDDRLVGIRTPNKKDFINGCNEPGTKWFNRDLGIFQRNICRICRNQECIRAGNAETPWHARMREQPEYLINNPQFSDLSLPRHQELAQTVFDDLTHKAMRLEVARIRQDWEIPGEDGPTDGYERIVDPKATDDVKEAIKELRRAQGKEVEEEPEPEQEDPKHFVPDEEPEPENDPGGPPVVQEDDPIGVEYETLYPSSDGKTNYRVMLMTDGRWSCECKGWENIRKCKHVDRVASWYEDNKDNEPEEEAQAPEPPPPQPPPQHPPPRPVQAPQPTQSYNTPMPGQGVMVDGSQAPNQPPSSMPHQPHDPWTPRQDKVVQPGATVVMKKKK